MPEEQSDKPADERRKRRVAVERKIKDITGEDSRITVLGTVINVDKDSMIFTIEDPSGQLTILASSEDAVSSLSVGKVVRVIGIVLPFEEGFELRAEVVQDFSELSKELFPVLHELM